MAQTPKSKAPADEPPLLADEVDKKKATLQRFCEPLMVVKAPPPAPAPAVEEPAAAAAAEEKANGGGEAPMQEEVDLSAPVEGEATMDQLE